MVSFLVKEKIVFSKNKSIKLDLPARGILRIVDKKGRTLGLVLDKATLDELEEEMESSAPKFSALLEKSRKSGRISGADVKRAAGL